MQVSLIKTSEGWSPHLSLDAAYKLNDVREALRRGDIERESKIGRIYVLTPVAV